MFEFSAGQVDLPDATITVCGRQHGFIRSLSSQMGMR
jgi:hypothetical protein